MNKTIKAYCPICNEVEEYLIIGKDEQFENTAIICSKCDSIKI